MRFQAPGVNQACYVAGDGILLAAEPGAEKGVDLYGVYSRMPPPDVFAHQVNSGINESSRGSCILLVFLKLIHIQFIAGKVSFLKFLSAASSNSQPLWP